MKSLYSHLSKYRGLDKSAIIDTNENTISYKQLFDNADSLAEQINSIVGDGNYTVGLCMPKSIPAVVCLFGILAARKVYVPIDPGFPDERVRYIVDNSRISLLIVDESVSDEEVEKYKKFGVVAKYFLNDNALKVLNDDKKISPESVSEDMLSYILFTSGTTGNPKGVMIKEESQVEFVSTMAEAFGHDQDTRWLSVSPMYFDVCTLDFFVEIYCGSTIYLASSTILPHELANALEKNKITHVLLISSMVKMLSSSYSGVEKKDLSNLKELWYGGEACPVESLRRIKSLFPHLTFAQCYGPSEVCNNATLNKFADIPADKEGYMPLGHTIDSVTGYVVDENMNLVNKGEKGELLLGGIQVMSGYVNDSKLTSSVLIDNQYDKQDKYKLYRTGDYVRIDEEGLLHFHGRKDDLVKVRGNRVSLHEVRAAIVSLPFVLDALVYVKKDDIAGMLDSLNAIVVSDDEDSDVSEVKRMLSNKLAKYMLPDNIVISASSDVPMNENGKLNSKQLLASVV